MSALRNTTLTVSVDAPLVDDPAGRLLRRLGKVSFHGVSTLQLCLRRLEKIDVAMVSAIVRIHGRLLATGRTLTLVNASEAVYDRIDAVGLTFAIAVTERSEAFAADESGLHPLR